MVLLCYEPSQRFALADEPEFPDEENIENDSTQNHEPVVLDEWRTYYLKWYDEKPDFVEHLPKSPFTRKHDWSGQVREINFNNYVGLARLGQIQNKSRKPEDR